MSEFPYSPDPDEEGPAWRVLQIATQSMTARRFIAPFGRWLQRRGHEVTIACSPRTWPDVGSYVGELRELGFEVIEIDYPRAIEPARDLRAWLRTVRLLQTRGFDVVHTHNSKAGILGRSAAAACGVRAVFHTNHGLAVDVAGRWGWWQERVHLLAERWASRHTDLIFTVSEAERAKALRYNVAPASRLVLVGQGIDAEFFSRVRVTPGDVARWRASVGIGPGPVVSMVARLVPEKGADVFIDAAARVAAARPDVTFVIAGDGPIRAALVAQVAAKGLAGRLRLLGHLQGADAVRLVLAASDVFMFPTRWESFGVVLLEAMAMEVPVLTSDIAPLDVVVQAGVTGVLAAVGDASAFAAALLKLLAHPTQAARLGAAGRARVLAEFDEEALFRRMEAAYRAVLQGPRPQPPRPLVV